MYVNDTGLFLEEKDFDILLKNAATAISNKQHNEFGERSDIDLEPLPDRFGNKSNEFLIDNVRTVCQDFAYTSLNHIIVTTPNKAAFDYNVDAESILVTIEYFKIPIDIKLKYIPDSKEITRENLKEYAIFSEGLLLLNLNVEQQWQETMQKFNQSCPGEDFYIKLYL